MSVVFVFLSVEERNAWVVRRLPEFVEGVQCQNPLIMSVDSPDNCVVCQAAALNHNLITCKHVFKKLVTRESDG